MISQNMSTLSPRDRLSQLGLDPQIMGIFLWNRDLLFVVLDLISFI